ncbi:multiple inositol polyphosphate phosphatase 1-like [Mercenaria mercenaria]|uniref:multiple inositol polyphosphate phosphatase 1-like n=1 Tax=Mercenaria mercenaria TaxID=6596 RepID=UPI00234ECD9D|nr:multiple inositol polyphosphate phosphatase 1-like [Mercenaria mercenaria]
MNLLFLPVILLVPYVESVSRWNVFSTNTLLQWIDTTSVHASDNMDRNVHFGISRTACTPIHLNMVVRDAAHFPSIQKMKDIKTLHEKIVQSKDSKTFPELEKWKLEYDISMADKLSSKGIEEITQLGSRIGKSFKDVLHDFAQNLRSVMVVSSSNRKAINSSKYFEQGLLSQLSKLSRFENKINDSTAAFSRNCYNHEKQQHEDISKHVSQFHNFSKSPAFVKIIDSVRRKLGMQLHLSYADVYLINEWCAYGTYISNDMTWCHLLTDEDRDVLEYGQDLLKYYEYSYGHQNNSKMACPLVRDIFNTLDSAINRTWNYFKEADGYEKRYVGAKFYFGDSDTLIPLLTALGMYKDPNPLLASNMKAMQDRKFKTSQISSFASSVAFILYACDNTRRLALNEFYPGQQEFRIHAFVNEKRVPFCSHQYYCLYDDVRETFTDAIENCNITEVCGVKPDRAEMIEPGDGASSPSLHMAFTFLSLFVISLSIFMF